MSQFSPEWRTFKPAEIRLSSGQVIPNNGPTKRSKYNAVPTCVLPDLRVLPAAECDAVPGRIRFASKREAERFVALRGELEAGRIADLTLQRAFELHAVTPQGVAVSVGKFVSDFTYQRDGKLVVEDAKGMRTDLYRWKAKHVAAEYGIEILET